MTKYEKILMKNNFTDKTIDLFFWNQECWWCCKSHANCLHHILGRVSTSPLNAAPLNNFECHIGNGKLTQDKYITMLLKKTYDYLKKDGYTLTKQDKEFIQKYNKYFTFIK